jgi:hypothetical protein
LKLERLIKGPIKPDDGNQPRPPAAARAAIHCGKAACSYLTHFCLDALALG